MFSKLQADKNSANTPLGAGAPSHVVITEGAELPDTSAARVEAAKRVGKLLHEHAEQIWVDQEWQMDITDEKAAVTRALALRWVR